MSRRGGGRQYEFRRDQSYQSQQTPYVASGRGQGRGRGGRGGRGRNQVPADPPPAYGSGRGGSHIPAYAPTPPSSARAPPQIPVFGSSGGEVHVPASASSEIGFSPSAEPVATSGSSSLPLASLSAESLSSEVEEKLAFQPQAPSSSKAVRFPDRPGYGRSGREIRVRANHFQLEVADRDLHHYDVSITPEVISKKVCRDIMSQLIKLYQEKHLGGRLPAYDGRKSLFTASPLPFTSQDFVVQLDDDNGSLSSDSSRRRQREFKVTIRFAAKADLYHLRRFLQRSQMDCPQETIQALDVVLRATPAEKYNVVGRSFFSPNLGGRGPLGQTGTEFWKGYYQSLRPTQLGLSLNIDVSARAYYEAVNVVEFIDKHFRLKFSRPLSDQDRVKLKKALKGLKVRLTHGQHIRSYKINGVTKEPLRELRFTLDDSTKKSVVEYFREKYDIVLQYSGLPALQAGSDTKPIYLPMELCQIEPGQRYTKRLNEEQVTALLKATCQRAEFRENSIKEIVRKHNFNSDKFVREFGIKVKEDLTTVNARVLPPPKLKYHETGRESEVDPRMGQWNMINKKMVDGGNVEYWTCLCFSTKVNRDLPDNFCWELGSMCTSKGMNFKEEPLIPVTQARPSDIETALKDVHKRCTARLKNLGVNKGLQLLIIILPDAKGSYGKIKRICETELGIVSQCCHPNQAAKMNKQYLENVALKINVKVGGRNTVLNDAFKGIIPHVSDIPTIIFGADVTHPQPGEDSSPSIAAVVASMDWPWVTKYRGVVSAQPHREEIIQDLYKTHEDPKKGIVYGGIIRELLIAFYRSTGQKPSRIIFYRDGVSEGQFSQVLLYEMDAIRKACLSLEETYLPPVTFVVVQKRHHTRLFPFDHRSRDQSDRSGNIMPGTVVDTTICHPREFDFYLNSHAGIQGTSRPTHYHVLFDENNFTADELQILTNNLCYTYARCTKSVSIVPPAYYAHLAAFRARYYIEGELSEQGGSASGSRRTVILPSIMENIKEVMFYC